MDACRGGVVKACEEIGIDPPDTSAPAQAEVAAPKPDLPYDSSWDRFAMSLADGCRADAPRDCRMLGFGLLYGRQTGLRQDPVRAKAYLLRGCELEDKDACYYLSDLLATGPGAVEPDQRLALAAADRGCELGHGLSCASAGRLESDRDKIVAYYTRACSLGVSGACKVAESTPTTQELKVLEDGWYCYAAHEHGQPYGRCGKSLAECREFRLRARDSGLDISHECEFQAKAACLFADDVLKGDGAKAAWCFESFEACDRFRPFIAEKKRDFENLTKCVAHEGPLD